MKKLIFLILSVSLGGCGYMPPASHKEIPENTLAYLKKPPQNETYRMYICQGKSLTRKQGNKLSESFVQPRNTQIHMFNDEIKIATFNDDESIVIDFQKDIIFKFDWKFEITNGKILESTLILSPKDQVFKNDSRVAHQKINRVLNISDYGLAIIGPNNTVYYSGGASNFEPNIEISSSNNFCEGKRIVFYKQIN